MYIINELEEMAREEFFRLKKILEIERKMFGEKKEKTKEPVYCTSCEPGRDWSVIERCVMCDALVLPEEEKTEENEKLEEFKSHLSEIVNMTKNMEDEGVIATSVEDFIKTAEQLKEKLEQKSESEKSEEDVKEEISEDKVGKLCEECKTKYLEEKAAQAKLEEPELEKPKVEPETQPIVPPQESKVTIKSMKPAPVEPLDLELGTFETEIQEITKIVRVKKEDGSVTEEKKVIRVKKQVRTPIKAKTVPTPNAINQERAGRITYQPSGTSGSSSKSNPYSGSRTVGIITTKSLEYFPFCQSRKAKSEILNPTLPMSDPIARYCMSSVTLLSVDFEEYNLCYDSSYMEYDECELITHN